MSILENSNWFGTCYEHASKSVFQYEEALPNNLEGAKITVNVWRLIKNVGLSSGLILSLREILNHRNWYTASLELSPVVCGWFLIDLIGSNCYNLIENIFWKAKK